MCVIEKERVFVRERECVHMNVCLRERECVCQRVPPFSYFQGHPIYPLIFLFFLSLLFLYPELSVQMVGKVANGQSPGGNAIKEITA